jgi:hypothetical protein
VGGSGRDGTTMTGPESLIMREGVFRGRLTNSGRTLPRAPEIWGDGCMRHGPLMDLDQLDVKRRGVTRGDD